MQLWIIQDGEKAGPFEDYDVREKIRKGEIDGETRVWHEGAEGWLPAREVQILEGEFVKEEIVPPPVPILMPPFLAWRRLGARSFDFLLYLLVLVSVLRAGGFDMIHEEGEVPSSMSLIAAVVSAVLMEAALVSSLGFTPGKWLMALRVENHLGKKLSTGFALIRSMRVWVLGMGMLMPLLMIVGHAVTLWFAVKKGAPLWDLHSGFRVPGSELKSGRVVLYWVLIVTVVWAIMTVVWPELGPMVEEEMRRQGK